MKKTALLLTQYERFGTVGKEEFVENYINEELEITIDMLGDYNEYLAEKGYETYFDDLDEVLDGYTPTEVARMTYYGKFSFAKDYHQFNGYGNLDSFDEYEIIREMKKDSDFLKWYVDYNELIDLDSEETTTIIYMANQLIAAGY